MGPTKSRRCPVANAAHRVRSGPNLFWCMRCRSAAALGWTPARPRASALPHSGAGSENGGCLCRPSGLSAGRARTGRRRCGRVRRTQAIGWPAGALPTSRLQAAVRRPSRRGRCAGPAVRNLCSIRSKLALAQRVRATQAGGARNPAHTKATSLRTRTSRLVLSSAATPLTRAAAGAKSTRVCSVAPRAQS